MAKMRFRATPVTPVKPARRRLGSAASTAAPSSGFTPFNESTWHLREGLELREGYDADDDLPTAPQPLDEPPRGGRPRR